MYLARGCYALLEQAYDNVDSIDGVRSLATSDVTHLIWPRTATTGMLDALEFVATLDTQPETKVHIAVVGYRIEHICWTPGGDEAAVERFIRERERIGREACQTDAS